MVDLKHNKAEIVAWLKDAAESTVICEDGRIVGEHRRCFGRRAAIYDPWHYVPVLARKPEALRNGAPFKDWVLPVDIERVRRKLASDDGAEDIRPIRQAMEPNTTWPECAPFLRQERNPKCHAVMRHSQLDLSLLFAPNSQGRAHQGAVNSVVIAACDFPPKMHSSCRSDIAECSSLLKNREIYDLGSFCGNA
jgi:hypothetical protein